MSLTAKQLAIIEAQLDEEQVQIKRYTHYARLARHRCLYNRLLEQLN